jgi:hypothetical protein
VKEEESETVKVTTNVDDTAAPEAEVEEAGVEVDGEVVKEVETPEVVEEPEL